MNLRIAKKIVYKRGGWHNKCQRIRARVRYRRWLRRDPYSQFTWNIKVKVSY